MTNGKQILIIDDDTVLVEMLSEQLRLHEEFATVSAASGAEALELSKKDYYDVIILYYDIVVLRYATTILCYEVVALCSSP